MLLWYAVSRALITSHTRRLDHVSPPLQRQDLPQPAADEWNTTTEQMFSSTCSTSASTKELPVWSSLLSINILLSRFFFEISCLVWCRLILSQSRDTRQKRTWAAAFLQQLWHCRATISITAVHFCVPCHRHRSSDASRRCDRATELISRLLLRLLRGDDETLFHRELSDLSGRNISPVSLLNTLGSQQSPRLSLRGI